MKKNNKTNKYMNNLQLREILDNANEMEIINPFREKAKDKQSELKSKIDSLKKEMNYHFNTIIKNFNEIQELKTQLNKIHSKKNKKSREGE